MHAIRKYRKQICGKCLFWRYQWKMRKVTIMAANVIYFSSWQKVTINSYLLTGNKFKKNKRYVNNDIIPQPNIVILIERSIGGNMLSKCHQKGNCIIFIYFLNIKAFYVSNGSTFVGHWNNMHVPWKPYLTEYFLLFGGLFYFEKLLYFGFVFNDLITHDSYYNKTLFYLSMILPSHYISH